MKQRLIFLLLFVGLSETALPQQVEWSSMERFRNKTAYNRVIGSNEHGYYVLRSKGYDIRHNVIIERYRESLGMDFSKKLPDMRGTELVNAFVTEIGIVLWKSRYNRQTEKLELFIEHLDTEGEPTGRPIPLLIAQPRNYSDDGDFSVTENQAGTHYVVTYSEMAPEGKSYLNVQVFDRRLERVSSRRQILEFEGKDFEINQILVDSLGQVFLLVSGVNPDMKKGTPERIGIHLFAMNTHSDWFDFYLNFEDTYIHSPIMVLDDSNDRVLVSGLYSLLNRKQCKGTLEFAIRRPDFQLLRHTFIPFSSEFVRDIGGPRAAEKEEELQDFVIRYMVVRSDGGYLLFGEEFSIAQQSYTYYVNGIAQVSSRSVYNYGKIFLLSYGPTQGLEWSKVISKGQSSVNDFGYYSSFTICRRKDRIHILFNDKLKGNGGVLNYTLYTDQVLEEEMLFGNQGAFISIVPSESKQLDANTVLIPTSKDRKFAFLKLTF
ncbi:MAG TPA: hypothetical protein DIW47_11095 [Bacteroidetes bacterium]|nr:hypothetical protein [Bacteroidota bacterium]